MPEPEGRPVYTVQRFSSVPPAFLFADSAEALIKKCDHQLDKKHHHCHISVQLCLVWLIDPVSDPICKYKRKLQTQHIANRKICMFYPAAVFFLIHILFYAFPRLHFLLHLSLSGISGTWRGDDIYFTTMVSTAPLELFPLLSTT